MYYVVASGKKKSKIGEQSFLQLEQKLKERNVEYKLLVSEYPGHAIELTEKACEQNDCEAIIALGGDGTFYEVLNGMDTRIPIGFIPAGTGNDFARTLGIGVDIDECLDNIIGKDPVYLDYLKVGNYRAFNLIGTGFDIQLLKREEKIRKKYSDKNSYHVALFQTILKLKFNTIKFKVDDGEEIEQKFFMIDCCNGRWGGGMMPLCIDADPHDGFIDFVVINKFSRLKILPLLLKFSKGKLYKTKYVKRYRCKKVEFSIKENLEVNLDGEILDIHPLKVEIVHNELKYFKSSKDPVDPLVLLNNRKMKKNAV